MKDTDRVALGWFLILNPAARKQAQVTELRCSRGCLLGAVVTIERRLFLLAVYNATKTNEHVHMSRFISSPSRQGQGGGAGWTMEQLEALTLSHFLEVWEQGLIKLADLKKISDGGRTQGIVYPLSGEHARRILRCRHIFGVLPPRLSVEELTSKRKLIINELEPVPPLRDYTG